MIKGVLKEKHTRFDHIQAASACLGVTSLRQVKEDNSFHYREEPRAAVYECHQLVKIK